MANPTPNNPNPPKKPGPPMPKGAAPGKVNGTPTTKPPPAKPAASKPAPSAKAGAKPGAKGAEPRHRAWSGVDGGNRKFGQVLVDLGYIDQEQLWDLLEQARTADQSLARVVLDRGLVTEDQLLVVREPLSGKTSAC